jgi:hypothetical protein
MTGTALAFFAGDLAAVLRLAAMSAEGQGHWAAIGAVRAGALNEVVGALKKSGRVDRVRLQAAHRLLWMGEPPAAEAAA